MPTVCSEITDTLSFQENSSFLGKQSFFFTNHFEMHSEFLIVNFIFKLAHAFKSFGKGQISRKPPYIKNLDNTSRSNQVN